MRAEWAGTQFPCVPGHEIVGRVAAVGAHVSGFKTGDLVGVGCIVDSCKHCDDCDSGLENYCDGMIGTYNFPTPDEPGWTLGGYSQNIVVHERYVLRIRHPRSPTGRRRACCSAQASPPIHRCATGTSGRARKSAWSAIGGLGHMGIKLAHAMGAHVVAFTTSESKREDARQLGADEVVVSRNAEEMVAHTKSFDFILNTVAAPHDLDALLVLLKRDGTMALVGAPATPHPSPNVFNLIMKRRTLAGSMIGGISETQEMLDFCAEHGIVADIELVRAEQINASYERMLKGDVKYRFVIDNATLVG